jgi:hypothetical protein
MTMIKRTFAFLVAICALAMPVAAQTATTQTSLSAAVTATATSVTLASGTNVAAGAELFVDQEDMIVLSAATSTAPVVLRGQNGTVAATHAANQIVWVGPAASAANPNSPFIQAPNTGACVAANQAYLPQIYRVTGDVYYCNSAGNWTSVNLNPVAGADGAPVTRVSDAAYTVKLSDYVIGYTSLSTSRVVTLPAAAGLEGHIVIVKDAGGNAGSSTTIVVGVTGSGTIDGSLNVGISSKFGVSRFIALANRWLTW